MGADFAARLATATSARFDDRRFGDPRASERALATIQKQHGLRAEFDLSDDELVLVVEKVRAQGSLTRRELIDACFALTIDLPDGDRLLDDEQATAFLLNEVRSTSSRPRRFRRAYGGLLNAYFSYRPEDTEDRKQWLVLRTWLSDNVDRLDAAYEEIAVLQRHKNVLTNDPCGRYGDIETAEAEVEELRDGLDVPLSSWLFGEIFVAQTHGLCRQPDGPFRESIDRLLEQAEEFPSFLPAVVAALLDRYASAAYKGEPHEALQDQAIAMWGNPLDKGTRGAWGAVKESTRKVVEGWVTRRVIDLFFSVISKKWATDRRRSDFWLKYADRITDFHLFLGDDAYYSRDSELKELREFLRGKYSQMSNTNRDGSNNGFMMVIDGVSFLEFSNHAHACYVYDAADLPFSVDTRTIAIRELKQQERCVGRLIHREAWEVNFRDSITRYTGRMR